MNFPLDSLGFQERRHEVLAQVRSHILKTGLSVMSVGAGEGFPTFTYTIGIWETQHHPELIVLGLSPQVSHPLLNLAFQHIQAGTRYADGSITDQLTEGYPTMFKQVHPTWQEGCLTVARRYYGERAAFESLQVVFPDAQHRWPWEVGSALAHMPELWLPQHPPG